MTIEKVKELKAGDRLVYNGIEREYHATVIGIYPFNGLTIQWDDNTKEYIPYDYSTKELINLEREEK